MKVFYNQNNSIAYKLFLSASLSKKNLESEVVSPDDPRFQTPRRLPVLLLDSGATVFSSNAGCLYLHPPSQTQKEEVETWLNWEATKLMPALVLVGSKPDPSAYITSLLTVLETSLKGKSYIVGETLTVADISLWSSLYPIYTEDKLKSQFFSHCPSILSWMDKLIAAPEFEAVVDKLKFKNGLEALSSISASCWYPTPVLTTKETGIGNSNSPTSEGLNNEVTVKEEDVKAAMEAWENGLKCRPKPKSKVKPVLPVPGEKNILITSALPYVNNVPHLGNIIGCVLSADVFARYCRMRNWNTLYICGTDEYGTATETKALEEGLTPKEICDKYFTIHSEIYKWFNIEFDHFGRTTTTNQTEVVQDIFQACHKNGYTLTAEMDQLLCQKCDKFLADRFVEGVCPRCKFEDARGDQCDGCGHLINAVELINPRCKICKNKPIVTQSQQLFLDLPKVEDKLSKWVEKSSEGWSANSRVITKSWLKSGLKPRCITRDLKWGIPVPLEGFQNKVFYVWFDAPIGYMSMTKGYTDDWLKWWKPSSDGKVNLYQFMAKDNVPFHSIMFPATLFAANRDYTLVNHLMATEYLNYEDGKFSKSRGVGVFGNDAKDTGIPSDIFRFYLLYVRPESQDSSFSWNDLASKNNNELLNNVGNFVHRSLTFIEKFFGNEITDIIIGDEEKQLLALITIELKNYIAALDKGKLRDGIRYILNISRYGNQYMQNNQPWFLIKGTPSEIKRAGVVASFCCNIIGLLTVLLYPYMPNTARNISEQLNLPQECFIITEQFPIFLPPGHRIGKPAVLFSKIEQATVDSLKEKYAGRQKSDSPAKEPVNCKNGEVKTPSPEKSPELIASLEAEVANQGEKVRTLKSSGADKSVWQPEVQILLDLKKKLAEAQGVPIQTPASGKKKNKK